MPSFELTYEEEALVTHVRGMVASATLAVTDKVPDVAEVHDSGHAAGFAAGQVNILSWMWDLLQARLNAFGPYEDRRTATDIAAHVADKMREVQAG